jgi:hypothetical protein
MVRLMGFPTLETNSSHAASSRGPAQRQTTSLNDRDEYRVDLGVSDILLCLFTVAATVDRCVAQTKVMPASLKLRPFTVTSH